jgi:hypothetical protein
MNFLSFFSSATFDLLGQVPIEILIKGGYIPFLGAFESCDERLLDSPCLSFRPSCWHGTIRLPLGRF